jgi:hypothetical protein
MNGDVTTFNCSLLPSSQDFSRDVPYADLAIGFAATDDAFPQQSFPHDRRQPTINPFCVANALDERRE